MNYIPGKGLPIPSDWNEETDGYQFMFLCIPNSRMWRISVKGKIYELTRGRGWDGETGSILQTLQIAEEIYGSICMANCDDLILQLTRIADALTITDGQGGETGAVSYLQHLQTLGAVPGAGDTIQTSLQKLVDRMPTDMTLNDLIDEINSNPELNKFKDFLEILTFMKDLTPAVDLKLPSVMPLLSSLMEARFKHNLLTINAYQATALRGIQNALTPFEGDENEDEETIVKELYDNLDKLPWLLTVVAALAEPTPAGETVVAAKMATTAIVWWNKIKDGLWRLWNQWANQVETPIPTSTVTGSLLDISRKLARDTDGYSGSNDPVSLFGILQGLALTQLHDDEGNLVSSADSLFSIAEELQNMQIINNINIDNCCDGGSGDPPDDGQPIEDTPPADDGGSYPPSFPNQATYDEYKCRAANQLRKHLSDTFTAIGNLPSFLGGRTFQNPIEIWDAIDALKYSFLPNAISYNLTPAALSSIVQQITLKYTLAWRDQAYDCPSGVQTAAVDEDRLFIVYRLMGLAFAADDELICDLLGDENATLAGSSVGLSITRAVSAALDENASFVYCNFTSQELIDFAGLLVTNSWLNILFTDSAYNQVLTADCSDCFPILVIFDFETGPQGWTGPRAAVSSLAAIGYGSSTQKGWVTNYDHLLGDSSGIFDEDDVRNEAGGLVGDVYIDKIGFDIIWAGTNYASQIIVTITYGDATTYSEYFNNPSPGTESKSIFTLINPDPEKNISTVFFKQTSGDANRRVFVVDNCAVYGSVM